MRSHRYKRHQAILQTTSDGFWFLYAKGRLIDVNIAYSQMSGYSRSELLQLSITDLIKVEKTPSGRYIYFDKIKNNNEKEN